MIDEQINTAIAEACGWRKEDGVYMWTANGIDCTCPELWDWCADLNAMHEAEIWFLNSSMPQDWESYRNKLFWTRGYYDVHATARQRAEAFLRTLGKWIE